MKKSLTLVALMAIKNLAVWGALFFVGSAAFAQGVALKQSTSLSNSASNATASGGTSSAGATANTGPSTAVTGDAVSGAAIGDISLTINQAASEIPRDTSVKVKSTGQAILPAFAVSSGGFNCAATAGVAAGGSGFSFSAGGSKSLEDCVKLNLLQFAASAQDRPMYEAVWCTMPAGREAMSEAGLKCPSDRRSAEQTAATSPAARQGQRPRVGTMGPTGQIVQ